MNSGQECAVAKVKKEISFEEKMGRLENIVAELEQQTLPLNEALGLYEEGVGLIKTCQKILAEAEQKVKILSMDNHE
jgi:exodeoxyribonuclease VII small subunit